MADKEAPPRPTASGADRLSALPDGVREHILSFLPAHEAVRTTVLARSWRDLWRRSPALRITGWGTVAKFPQFVDRLLRLHRSACFHPGGGGRDPCAAAPAPLDACHFDFGRSHFDDELDGMGAEERVNEWIQSALRCRLRVLRFCYARDCEPLDLPDLSLAATKHLTRLEIAGVAIFRNLNLSGCPALTDLKMDDCIFCAQEIQAPSLKHLTMSSVDFLYNHRVRIRLPSLLSLKLIKCHGWTPFLARMPLLETAIVTHTHDFDDTCSLMSVDGCGDEHCMGCGDYYVSHPDRKSCLLLGGLSEATHLELSAPREMVVYIRDLKFAHTFGKLKTLILADWFVAPGLSALIWFLDHSPILEKLTLEISEVYKNTITTEGSCELPASPVASSRLNIVKIKCPEVDGIVIEILKILAASGVPLEKVNIQRSITESDCVNFKCTGFGTK